MKNKVSIIVPVFNSQNTIKKCLSSLLRQTYTNYHIYIINDGSTDNTSIILSKFLKNKKITVINNKNNYGPSITRNIGLSLITSKYVTFVDSDDFVGKDYLKHLVYGFKNNGIDLSIIGFKFLNKNYEIIRKSTYNDINCDAKNTINKILERNGPGGYLWNKMFKTKIIRNNNIKMNPEIYVGEDLIFCVKYLLYAKYIQINGRYHDYNYVQQKQSLSSGLSMYDTKNYIATYSNYIMSLLNLIQIIPDDYRKQKNEIKAKIGKVCSDFIRMLRLTKKWNSVDSDFINMVKNEPRKNFKYVLRSSNINYCQKIIFLIAILFPKIVLFIDSFRFR